MFPDERWRGAESNCRHRDFQSRALPTELPRPRSARIATVPEVSGAPPGDRGAERLLASICLAPVEQLGVLISLSRRRSPVQIWSGAPNAFSPEGDDSSCILPSSRLVAVQG